MRRDQWPGIEINDHGISDVFAGSLTRYPSLARIYRGFDYYYYYWRAIAVASRCWCRFLIKYSQSERASASLWRPQSSSCQTHAVLSISYHHGHRQALKRRHPIVFRRQWCRSSLASACGCPSSFWRLRMSMCGEGAWFGKVDRSILEASKTHGLVRNRSRRSGLRLFP